MVVLVKAIKPPKLKEGAMRLALLNAMRKAGTTIKKDFEKTTETWKKKPKFETSISLRKPGPTIIVETDNEIYGYVNNGTEGHLIFAGALTGKSKARTLAFPSKFKPKTKVRKLKSFRGFKGGPTVFRPSVGQSTIDRGYWIKARQYDEVIKKKRTRWFSRQMNKAMRRAVRKSGHAAG